MKKEPVAIIGAITAAVAAVIALLVAFGLPVTEQQQDAILAAIGPVAVIVIVLLGRRMVTPNGSVVEHEQAGKIIAGQGSELATGTVIRDAGSLNGAPSADPA